MPDADLTRLGLAVLIQAPFAFRLGFVVRDGRQWLFGSLFLAVGSAVAAIAAGFAGSLLVGVRAALVAVFVLAHARFMGAQRPLFAAVPPPVPTSSPAAPPGGSPPTPPVAAPPCGTSPPAGGSAAAAGRPPFFPVAAGEGSAPTSHGRAQEAGH